ncbi:hypothetical protein [Sporosarcina sp. ITBMC105]
MNPVNSVKAEFAGFFVFVFFLANKRPPLFKCLAPSGSCSGRFGNEAKGKERLSFISSDIQDVLVPTLPQDVAFLVGHRLSQLNATLRFSLLTFL